MFHINIMLLCRISFRDSISVMRLLLLYGFFIVTNMCFSQTIIVIDNDVTELVEDVNYSLYKNSEEVYKSVTLNDKATTLPDVLFDSIAFSKADYETLGLLRRNIDSVIYLTKRVIHLDEVVINSSKDKEIVLGETHRFVKRGARPLLPELDFGTVFRNSLSHDQLIKKAVLYVDKVKWKTAYKLNFSKVSETPIKGGAQFADVKETVYTSDTLYLKPGDKGKIELELPQNLVFYSADKLFVWFQLLSYYDVNGVEIQPEPEERTKLKFQLSNHNSYYSRMSDFYTHKSSASIINSNLLVTYDLMIMYSTTPHKSSLVTPAVVLYATKLPE